MPLLCRDEASVGPGTAHRLLCLHTTPLEVKVRPRIAQELTHLRTTHDEARVGPGTAPYGSKRRALPGSCSARAVRNGEARVRPGKAYKMTSLRTTPY